MIQKTGTHDSTPYTFEQFDTISEFLQTVEARPISDAYSCNSTAHNVRSDSIRDPRWTGAPSYEAARRMFTEGTAAKAEMRKAYAATQLSRKRESVAAPCGAAPIVANALRGLPNSMVYQQRKREPKTARLVVNMAIRCSTTAREITEAGRQIIEAAGKLESAGVATEIICTSDQVINHAQIVSCGIVIKNAGQAFNAARVSFSMSSPAFLRVFMFEYLSSREGVQYDSGYGRALTYALQKESARAYQAKVYGPGIYLNIASVATRGAAAIDEALQAWKEGRV